MKALRRLHVSPAGFALIEVIVVIAILAVVAGALAPLAVRTIDSSRQDLTFKRQQLIYQAIFGDSLNPGSGFLSDIGRLPGADLSELAVAGSLSPYSIQACGIGMGWRGPYLLEGIDATGRPLDGWGMPMRLASGQILSAGPDRDIGTTPDNLVYPMTPITTNNLNGSIVLSVFALDNGTSPPVFVQAGGQATLCFAQNGIMQNMSIASPSGSYLFPQGIKAITITGDPDGIAGPQPAITGTITVYCPGGGTVHQTAALR